MAPHDGPDETESEAVSRSAAAALETDKPVEHGLSIGFRNTQAAVGYLKNGAAIAAQNSDLNFAAAGIFEPIVEQIG